MSKKSDLSTPNKINDIPIDELKENISTMQDDLAQVMKIKNKSNKQSFISTFKKIGSRSKEIQHELAEVYTDVDGEIPDMTKLEHLEMPLWQKLLYWVTAFFAIIFFASLIGFLVFSNLSNDSFTNERVIFKIEPPLSVVSGQESVYTLIITNNEKVNLYDLNIDLKYPEDFQYVSSTPEASGDKKNSWSIGILRVGETIKIELTGKIIASLGSVHNLSGVLTFKPENINSEFQQKVSLDLGVNASVINVNISGPDKLLSNQNGDYVITLKNVGLDNLKDIEVIAEYPQGFVFSSSSPQTKAGSNRVWEIAELVTSTEASTSTEKKIIISGNFSGVSESGNQEIRIKVNLKKSSDWILQSEQSIITNIIKDQLKLTLIVNGSGEDQPVNFGDLLIYTASFKNTGHEDLKNIELTAHLDSDILDWDSLKDSALGKKSGNSLTWTGKQVPQLLNLRPGEEGSISWQIRVKDFDSLRGQDIGRLSVESYLEAKAIMADNESSVLGKTIVNSVNSDLNLEVGARYYNEDNVALGAGPIKPQVGQASSYNIFFKLNNNIHDISNIEVSASLPAGVNWDNKEDHDTGDVIYNSKTRKLSWTISRLSKKAEGAYLNFNVSITPKESDGGRVLVLIPEVRLSAKDIETGADISKTVKAITTAFNDPILGNVSGIVE